MREEEKVYSVIGGRGGMTVFEIFIKTTPERLWEAIVDPEMRAKYSFGRYPRWSRRRGQQRTLGRLADDPLRAPRHRQRAPVSS